MKRTRTALMNYDNDADPIVEFSDDDDQQPPIKSPCYDGTASRPQIIADDDYDDDSTEISRVLTTLNVPDSKKGIQLLKEFDAATMPLVNDSFIRQSTLDFNKIPTTEDKLEVIPPDEPTDEDIDFLLPHTELDALVTDLQTNIIIANNVAIAAVKQFRERYATLMKKCLKQQLQETIQKTYK